MSKHFASLLQTQRLLGEKFSELQRTTTSPDDLIDEFVRNGECQRALARNGEALLHAMNGFVDTLQTLITKTMEDTLITIKAYENARIEFDAHRRDYEILLAYNSTTGSTSSLSDSDEFVQRQYYHFKERYEKLKSDVTVKFKLLDENRTKVMKQQLVVFHNAIAAYFSVNRQQLNL